MKVLIAINTFLECILHFMKSFITMNRSKVKELNQKVSEQESQLNESKEIVEKAKSLTDEFSSLREQLQTEQANNITLNEKLIIANGQISKLKKENHDAFDEISSYKSVESDYHCLTALVIELKGEVFALQRQREMIKKQIKEFEIKSPKTKQAKKQHKI